MYIRTNTVWA